MQLPESYSVETQVASFQLALEELTLTDFRSHASLRLSLSGKPVILTGPNGAGKTNILEAISFLSPGRGMRQAKISDITRRSEENLNRPWVVMARVRTKDGLITIGTGKDDSGEGEKRAIHIEGEKVRGQSALAEHLSVCYLTPQMDQVFASGTQSRRQLLDRITTLFAPDHIRHLSIYEQAKSERKRVLFTRPDEEWLHVLETRMSEQAVAIAAARLETLALLQQAIDHATSAFPKALLSIKGEVEQDLQAGLPALEVETRAQKLWALSRTLDRQSGRTNIGVHRSEFLVHHKTHGMEAEFCSTGEQKALLISIVLASARAKSLWSGVVPILLLDEVAAHLDETRRRSLFDELRALGTQCWMTGTDTTLFDPFLSDAEVITLPPALV